MFNAGKPLPKDHADVARRTKARLFDEERKKRIFNPAARTIGIDKDALDRQVEEKKRVREQEAEKNRAYSQKLLRDCATSLKLEEQNRQKQKRLDLEMLEYRRKYQAPETRREYDLNDPLGCKTGQPNRIDDNDPRVTVSSTQRFEGEAAMTMEQKAEQIEQQRVWLEMQIREKKLAREEDANVERNWRQTEQATVRRSLALASLENECRQKLTVANYRYNQALAAEQRTNNDLAEAENNEDKLAEVYNAMTGDFLTENPERGFQSAMGPGKISVSLYKGLTPAMNQAIYDEQAEQRAELKKRKEASKKQEKDWADLLNMLATCATLSDREKQREKRSLEIEVKNFNLKMADGRKEPFDKACAVDERFFEQFNKSTR